ncbi:MAG: Ig-like domain-containing protein [Bacilli bacterium]|nr:Ig-like domain-containing protein [Bacilli bacterium]
MKKQLLVFAIALPLLGSCNSGPHIEITNPISILETHATHQLKCKKVGIGDDVPLIYTSSDATVASVDDGGLITGVAIGKATITVASSKDAKIATSFNLTIADAYVKGVVKDAKGNPLKDVYVSDQTSSRETYTNGKGEYEIQVEHDAVIYFEKDGYLTKQSVLDFNVTNGTHSLNVTLEPKSVGKWINISGKVTELGDQPIAYEQEGAVTLSIKQGDKFSTASTNESGEYAFSKKILVGSEVTITAYNSFHNPYAKTFEVTGDALEANLDLDRYQEDLIFLQGDKEMTYRDNAMIIGHVYCKTMDKEDGIWFDFNANFDAFNDKNKFTICVDAGIATPSIPNHGEQGATEDSNDFDISFNKNGFVGEQQHYGGAFNDTYKDKTKFTCDSPYHMEVFIPYKYPGMAKGDVFGIYFQGEDVNLGQPLGKCRIFGHTMSKANELSYIRINEKNEAFASTDNSDDAPLKVNFDFIGPDYEALTWDTKPSAGNWRFAHVEGKEEETILGKVGYNLNHGYYFKVAKRGTAGDPANDTGIYFLAKMINSDMNTYFLEDSLIANVFLDANPGSDYSKKDIDPDINRFGMVSNYEVKRSWPKDDTTPFDKETNYLDEKVYKLGIRYYTNRDFAMLYVPYEAIATWSGNEYKYDDFAYDSPFGIAPNLNYKKTDWYHWEGNNPTGYKPGEGDHDQTAWPHFENRKSYIHLNPATLEVIPVNA